MKLTKIASAVLLHPGVNCWVPCWVSADALKKLMKIHFKFFTNHDVVIGEEHGEHERHDQLDIADVECGLGNMDASAKHLVLLILRIPNGLQIGEANAKMLTTAWTAQW